jgi:hypothetical protein
VEVLGGGVICFFVGEGTNPIFVKDWAKATRLRRDVGGGGVGHGERIRDGRVKEH